jgi:acetoin utilization protein AcuB
MIISELINHDIPILKPTDSVGRALNWMEENHINQLIVADSEKYIGIVDEELLDEYEEELPLAHVMMQYSEIYLFDSQHIYQALAYLSKYQLKIIGVLDENQRFVGVVTATEIYNKFSELLGTQENGAILVISIKNRDYSLAEISRLIEIENAKIISSYFSENFQLDNHESFLTLKLNTTNISPIVNTLERFGYSIASAYAHQPIENIEQERYDLLMRYLSI